MPRFDVHRNANAASARAVPYLLDVQHGLFSVLGVRVVIPLVPAEPDLLPMARLNPVFEIDGRPCVLLTPEIAGVPSGTLGPVVQSLAADSAAILGAIEFLLTAE